MALCEDLCCQINQQHVEVLPINGENCDLLSFSSVIFPCIFSRGLPKMGCDFNDMKIPYGQAQDIPSGL